jgi:bacillithiol biosynthesis cysteine-adding enzyme BshC
MSLRFHPTPLPGAGAGSVQRAGEAQARRARDASLRAALIGSGEASDNLDVLLETGTLAVTSGQQAGLFTGPLYTIEKALSAAAFAAELGAAGRKRVVPVFWVAGDDHDFAEINHCTVTGADGRPARIAIRDRDAAAPMLPAWREPIGSDTLAAIGELEAALPPGDHRTETIALMRRTYGRPGAADNLAEAHACALAELLGPYGVVIARGWHPALKRAARQPMAVAIERAAELERTLAAKPGPVEVGDGMSLVMLDGEEGRDRLRIAGPGRFATRRGRHELSADDVLKLMREQPERVSANVLLRPAIEAAVFPTVAYFGGPGELAYLEQTGPVFDLLGVPRPARLPRLSGMLVEQKVDKVLERYGLATSDLAQDEGALASRVARQQLPASAGKALASLREEIRERYAAVQAEATRIDPTLERTAENARNSALLGSEKLEKKLVAALRRSHETAITQVTRARQQLYPGGAPQERVISIVSFLARHGRGVLDLLYDAARQHARRLLEAPSTAP